MTEHEVAELVSWCEEEARVRLRVTEDVALLPEYATEAGKLYQDGKRFERIAALLREHPRMKGE